MYYQVEGSNVRIAGTLHLFPADRATLPPWVYRAYAWSERFIFEHDSATATTLFRMAPPPGSAPADCLDPMLLERLQEVMPSSPYGKVEDQKLWVIMMRLSLAGVQLASGVEPILTIRAKSEGKPIEYLETGFEFAAAADQIEPSRFAPLIEAVLNTLHQNEQKIRRLHAAWITCELSALESVMSESILAADPVIRSVVIDQRTQAWMPKILAAISAPRPTLVAAGALHLIGPNGLLKLLEQAGQSLTCLLD